MRGIKRRIKALLQKSKLGRSIFASLQKWRRCHYYKSMYLNVPIDENLILFESFLGKSYSCSPRAIYEAMKSNSEFDKYKFVWVFRRSDEMRKAIGDDRTIIVKYNSRRYYRAFAQAKYWVTNWRLPAAVIKKEDQICVQTWHGTPLKKIGIDLEIEGNATTSQKKGHSLYLNDAKMYDYFVSPSRFCTDVFSSAFGLSQLKKTDILIETGYPRNDRLACSSPEEVEDIRKAIGIPEGKTVLLYAPTWRDNQYTTGVGYSFELDEKIDYFLSRLPEDYLVLMRLHYLVANSVDLEPYGSKVIDVSKYGDINDLYIASDALITDYSSVFFDYANLKRPILFFMYDLQEYQSNVRDFYIELDTLPGPIIEDPDELLVSVGNLAQVQEAYRSKYSIFCDTYTYLDDGNAGLRVAQICFS